MDCPVALCQCSIILSNRRDIPRVHKVEVQNMSMNIFVTSSLTVPWAAEAEVAEVRELDPSPGRARTAQPHPARRQLYALFIVSTLLLFTITLIRTPSNRNSPGMQLHVAELSFNETNQVYWLSTPTYSYLSICYNEWASRCA